MKGIYKYTVTREKVSEIREDSKANGPLELVDFLRTLPFVEAEQEHFLVVMLDAKNKIKAYTTVTIGLVDRSQVHAREVFRAAIIAGACRVVFAHNHPSGDPTPSPQDLTCTNDLVAAGKIIGIEVIDHIVMGEPTGTSTGWLSFREQGLL